MGGKLTEAAAQRSARSITVLNEVMNAIYTDCNKSYKRGYHGNRNCSETVASIVTDLLEGNVFNYVPNRGYPSFRNFKSNILDIDYRNFFSWTHRHLKQWKGVYETPNNQ